MNHGITLPFPLCGRSQGRFVGRRDQDYFLWRWVGRAWVGLHRLTTWVAVCLGRSGPALRIPVLGKPSVQGRLGWLVTPGLSHHLTRAQIWPWPCILPAVWPGANYAPSPVPSLVRRTLADAQDGDENPCMASKGIRATVTLPHAWLTEKTGAGVGGAGHGDAIDHGIGDSTKNAPTPSSSHVRTTVGQVPV